MLRKTTNILLAVLVIGLAAAPVYADKPDWAGSGKNKGGYQSDRKDSRRGNGDGGNRGADVNVNIGAYFGVSQRQVVHDYYGSQFKAGKCPPGLAKKNNGCQPPGQAKKWARGYALPSNVDYYPVPSTLVARLAPPPSGYKYVRVASDILLITIGTSMVIDAIEDIGGM
ncbi:hypothetical protein D3C87_164140 [compost metagenome]